MAQALGGRYGLSHGAMNALCLPPGLRFTSEQAPEQVRRFAVATRGVALDSLARLGGFERLRDFGVPEAELSEVATVAAGRPGNKNMPRPATPVEIEELLRSIY
jgi:alcohol dehydrogenase class IV